MHLRSTLLVLPGLLALLISGCSGDSAPAGPVPTDATDGADAVHDALPRYAWARLISGPSDEDEIDAVTSDGYGNVYISGKFERVLTIEGSATKLTSAGMADIMVAKYSSTGALQWVRQYGGTSEDNVFDADTDGAGNVYLSGYFGGTVSFDGIQLTSVGDLDMMVVKLSPVGYVLWATRMGGPGTDGGNEISIAPDGTIAVVAGSTGTFTGGNLTFTTGSTSQHGVLLTMDGVTGSVRWGGQIAGSGVARLKCLEIDGNGNVFAGGDYAGMMSVRGPNRTDALPTPRGFDAFLTAWTPGGQLRWTKAWGGTGPDLCKGLAATTAGDVFAVGYVSDDARLDQQTLPVSGSDLYVWKLDTTGATRWLAHIESADDLTGSEITLTPDDGIVFGHNATEAVTYSSSDGHEVSVVPPVRAVAWPRLVAYGPDGVPRQPLLPSACTADGNMGEIARTGRRAYIDVPIFGGTYTFGPDTRTGTSTKDALIVAVDM